MASRTCVTVVMVSAIAVTSAFFFMKLHTNDLSWSLLSRSKSYLQHRQKILAILTQTRSGSSFTGEIFAAANNSLYLYEPLYPFGLECNSKERDGKEALLKQLLSCDFLKLNNIYSYGFSKSGWPSDGAECRKHGLCFTGASKGLMKSYAKVCKTMQSEPKNCAYPLRPDVLTKLCKSTKLLITKINRICRMEELEKVSRHLAAGKRQLYVLHLVRDLRSIASSHVKLSNKKSGYLQAIVEGITKNYCSRQRHNIEYSETHRAESKIIADERYIRVRYEDLVKNPDVKVDEVFRFMGLSLPPEVVANIHNYLHPDKAILEQIAKKVTKKTPAISQQYRSPFGVVRDPTKVLDEWRNIVPFNVVQQIQENCGDVLKMNGYVLFTSENQMKNLSLSTFQDIDPTSGFPKLSVHG